MRRSVRLAAALAPVVASILVLACGGDAPTPVTPTAAPALSVLEPSPVALDAGVTDASLATVDAGAPGDDKFAAVQIKTTQVAGGVYMLEGAGGNIGVLVGDDGLVIVDDEYAPLADKIRAALKGIRDVPIKFILNTHAHPDHVGGNVRFGTDAPIVAQENVRKHMMEGRPPFMVGTMKAPETPPAPKEALPIVTFEHDVSLHVDGEDIHITHYPNGHTDGDAVVFFPKANVVHMGDDFVTSEVPFVDVAAGGSVLGMIAAVEAVVASVPNDVKVIPGHGALSTVEDMRAFAARLREMVSLVQAAKKTKKTRDAVIAARPLAKYADKAKGPITIDGFTAIIFDELSKPQAKTPRPTAAPQEAGRDPWGTLKR